MNCKIVFYGEIAEKIGMEVTTMHITDGVNLRTLFTSLYPELLNTSFQIAVNNEMKESIDKTTHNEIAVLPPFAGG